MQADPSGAGRGGGEAGTCVEAHLQEAMRETKAPVLEAFPKSSISRAWRLAVREKESKPTV